MYSVYDTDAFILESSGKREADKFFSLYTEDFGRISATAQGVRLSQSKLRGHLSDYSLLHVSIVRGKDQWRIVSAERIISLPDTSRAEHQLFIRAIRLLHRLVKGEEIHPELFALLKNGYESLSSKEIDTKSFEALIIVRMLHHLGYIAPTDTLKPYLSNNDFSPARLTEFSSHVREAIKLINTAIHESQL